VPVLAQELAVAALAGEGGPGLEHVAREHDAELRRQPSQQDGARVRDLRIRRVVREPGGEEIDAVERVGQEGLSGVV